MIRADDDAIELRDNEVTVGECRLAPIPSPAVKFRQNRCSIGSAGPLAMEPASSFRP